MLTLKCVSVNVSANYAPFVSNCQSNSQILEWYDLVNIIQIYFGDSNSSVNQKIREIQPFGGPQFSGYQSFAFESLSFALALKRSKSVKTESIFHARIVHTFVDINTTSIFGSFWWFFHFQLFSSIHLSRIEPCLYPRLQSQSYEPCVLMQSAFSWHGLVLHSSIS